MSDIVRIETNQRMSRVVKAGGLVFIGGQTSGDPAADVPEIEQPEGGTPSTSVVAAADVELAVGVFRHHGERRAEAEQIRNQRFSLKTLEEMRCYLNIS